MVISVEEVIYLYIVVCICMLIFNICFILYRKNKYKSFRIHTRDVSNLVNIQLEQIAHNELIEQNIQIRLKKMLTRHSKLMAFHEVIEDALTRDALLVQQYLLMSRHLFSSLAVKYMRKDDMKKAYFAYLMSRYKVCKNIEHDVIIKTMLQLIDTKSAFCRENALKALYSFGNERNVLAAINIINEKQIFHHEKLLADGLVSFEGDKVQLAALLWQHFNKFNNDIQIAIVKYTHAVSGQYKEEFYSLLLNENTNREVKFSIIRYFGKHVYEPMQSFLCNALTDNSKDWEFIAISASVIRAYPSNETLGALKIAMNHSNWYIRYNAADSLNALSENFKELASIYNGTDQFARDMLLYQDQRNRIKVNKKREVLES